MLNLPFSYDRHGINDSEGNRIATLSDSSVMKGADYHGRLLAAAPDMKSHIEEYLDLYSEMKGTACEIDKNRIIDRMNNLRREMITTIGVING